jgi:hypothetical protein
MELPPPVKTEWLDSYSISITIFKSKAISFDIRSAMRNLYESGRRIQSDGKELV